MISVFGGTGFIGSNYCRLFDSDAIMRNEVHHLGEDVLYFISTTHNYHVLTDNTIDINTNLIHLIKVLEAHKKNGGVFNFISSWFVYGDSDIPAREDSICYPKGFYSITKKCAEDLIISYCKTFDMNYRILRLGNVYGGEDNYSAKKNALQYLVNEIKKSNPINLYHNGDFIRDYLHVNDVCAAINLVVESGQLNEIFNIGSGVPYCFRELIDIAIKRYGSKSKITSIEPPDFHKLVQVKDMYLDTTKLRKLGFNPSVTIKEGIESL